MICLAIRCASSSTLFCSILPAQRPESQQATTERTSPGPQLLPSLASHPPAASGPPQSMPGGGSHPPPLVPVLTNTTSGAHGGARTCHHLVPVLTITASSACRPRSVVDKAPAALPADTTYLNAAMSMHRPMKAPAQRLERFRTVRAIAAEAAGSSPSRPVLLAPVRLTRNRPGGRVHGLRIGRGSGGPDHRRSGR